MVYPGISLLPLAPLLFALICPTRKRQFTQICVIVNLLALTWTFEVTAWPQFICYQMDKSSFQANQETTEWREALHVKYRQVVQPLYFDFK